MLWCYVYICSLFRHGVFLKLRSLTAAVLDLNLIKPSDSLACHGLRAGTSHPALHTRYESHSTTPLFLFHHTLTPDPFLEFWCNKTVIYGGVLYSTTLYHSEPEVITAFRNVLLWIRRGSSGISSFTGPCTMKNLHVVKLSGRRNDSYGRSLQWRCLVTPEVRGEAGTWGRWRFCAVPPSDDSLVREEVFRAA